MEENNISKENKSYTVEVVSTDRAYDEKQLLKSIFESLYIINDLSIEPCTEELKEGVAVA